MEAVYIASEHDLKRWVQEAVHEYFQKSAPQKNAIPEKETDLLSRKEVAKILHVSLVTLTDWMKRGLPYHKQRGRVYFIQAEVFDYIKKRNS